MHTNKYKHKIQIQLQLQLQIQISDDGLRQTILWAGQAAVDRGNHQSTQTEKDLHIFQIWREEHVTCYCFWYWQIDIGQEKTGVFVYVKPRYQSKMPIAFLFWPQDIWDGVMTSLKNYGWLGWFSDPVPKKMKACQNLPCWFPSLSADSEWPERVAFGKTWFISQRLKTLGKLSKAGG